MYSLSKKHQQNVFFIKKVPTKCILYQKSTNKMYSLLKKHKQNVFFIKKAQTKCILYQNSTNKMYSLSNKHPHNVYCINQWKPLRTIIPVQGVAFSWRQILPCHFWVSLLTFPWFPSPPQISYNHTPTSRHTSWNLMT